MPPILPPVDGFLFLDRDKFHASFAGDDPAADAAFMADSRTKPSWYLLTTEDRMIPPAAQRLSGRAGATVTDVDASHSV